MVGNQKLQNRTKTQQTLYQWRDVFVKRFRVVVYNISFCHFPPPPPPLPYNQVDLCSFLIKPEPPYLILLEIYPLDLDNC